MRTVPKQNASFNTHQVIKRLVAKGIKEAHAEEIVDAILEGRSAELSHLATKEQFMEVQKDIALLKKDVAFLKMDLKGLRSEMVSKIDGLRGEVMNKFDGFRREMATKVDIEKTKIQLIVWLGGFIVAATSIIIGFLQFFYH